MEKFLSIGNCEMPTKNFLRNGFWIFLCLLAFAPWTTRAQSREYQIKAAFLFNFAQFVTWPPTTFADTNAPFCIGILGDDPFGSSLEETIQGEKVNGHPLTIQHYRSIQEITNCQILFISRSENKQDVLESLKGKKILTVGDSDDFLKNGGVIRFVTEEGKIHLRISLEAAKNADLTISSKMLRLAEIVEPEKN
jgi:hypothetical protein